MTAERWLPTRLDPRYEVSSEGRVRRGGKLLKLSVSDSGYLRARPLGRVLLVHKAVLEAFVGPAPSPRHEAAHKDGRKHNNRLDNLEWKLKEHNEADKKVHGTAPRRFSGHRRSDHVARVFALAGTMSFTRIAKETGLHRSSVSRIVRGLRRRGWTADRRGKGIEHPCPATPSRSRTTTREKTSASTSPTSFRA